VLAHPHHRAIAARKEVNMFSTPGPSCAGSALPKGVAVEVGLDGRVHGFHNIAESVEMRLKAVPGYERLIGVLLQAYDQAARGKGVERHGGGGVPFHEQPMMTINRALGSTDGFVYQAHKKSLESTRLDNDAAVRELLGAINYLAGAVIFLEDASGKAR
jgi:hypothetical protein